MLLLLLQGKELNRCQTNQKLTHEMQSDKIKKKNQTRFFFLFKFHREEKK
jgi:hypothetical protein